MIYMAESISMRVLQCYYLESFVYIYNCKVYMIAWSMTLAYEDNQNLNKCVTVS